MSSSAGAAFAGDLLVRYEHPELLTKKEEYTTRKGLARRNDANASASYTEETSATLKAEVINSITPPREFDDGGQAWIQYVSSAPSTTAEVIKLQSKFDKLLEDRQARETSICPIREDLYSQCFDEIIRMEAVICAERGALLLRVRDELRTTVDSLQVAYQSSLAYGVRHAVECEQACQHMGHQIRELEETKRERHAQVSNLMEDMAERVEMRTIQREEDAVARQEAIDELGNEEAQYLAQLNEKLIELGLKEKPKEEKPKEEEK
jgi:dynein light intermediate chain